jgi:MEMO1 family protein
MAMFSGKTQNHIRKPAVAGRFYSGNKTALKEEIYNFFMEAKLPAKPEHTPRAIIVPHAGYVFSGKVAASGFNQIPDNSDIQRVFILASSHQMHFPGASVYCTGNYETPLGVVEVDKTNGKLLTESNNLFSCREDAHLFEHSLEVQLPFLQAKLGKDFKLVPIILGTQKPEECRQMAKTLQPFLTSGNLFVVSSDFSHYPGYDDAVKNDRITTEAILSKSPELLLKTIEENKTRKIPGLATSLCGWTSVLTLLYMIQNTSYDAEWIDYQNSGDQPLYGDHTRVVGYSSIAFYDKTVTEFRLTGEEKAELLYISENSVRALVVSGKSFMISPEELKGTLAKKAGAFVSAYISGKLRGCMGSFEGDYSLAEVVNRSAASAAQDQRFEPISEEELENLSIEISVLTPLKRINSKNEIEIGKHGIYIRKGLNSGTFLPQVGEKYNWTIEEFLGRCSRDKAGLGWEGWKDAELYIYEAIIFGSSHIEATKSSNNSCQS